MTQDFCNVLPEGREKVVGSDGRLKAVGLDGRLAVSLNEAAALIGSSRRSLEMYIAAKLLPSRKIGKRRLILVRDLLAFLRRDQPSPRAVRDAE